MEASFSSSLSSSSSCSLSNSSSTSPSGCSSFSSSSTSSPSSQDNPSSPSAPSLHSSWDILITSSFSSPSSANAKVATTGTANASMPASKKYLYCLADSVKRTKERFITETLNTECEAFIFFPTYNSYTYIILI